MVEPTHRKSKIVMNEFLIRTVKGDFAMKDSLKKAIVYAWEWLYLAGAFPGLQQKTVIFMLHRMATPDRLCNGHSDEFLNHALTYLSRKGYNFVSLEEVFNNIRDGGPPLKKAIAFTIDDGFIDQARIAAPIFIKHQCPVTIFLITGFVDNGSPPWDAFLKYVFYKMDNKQITVKLKSKYFTYKIDTSEERYNSMNDFRKKCKNLSEPELMETLQHLATELGLENTCMPIAGFQALSWEDAVALENFGISFSPHTISHAILSNYSDFRAHEEITGSWQRLVDNLKHPCPVFAYPNGHKKNFTMRDINYIKELGLLGAVTAEPGYVDLSEFTDADRYLIKRMSFPSSLEYLIQSCTGLEFVKQYCRELILKYKHAGRIRLLTDLMLHTKYQLGGFKKYENIDWKKITRLVFVCKGNICRSPYAELRAREMCINTISIGLDTTEGSMADADAVSNASYRGIDLTEHRARTYTSIEFSSSDLVICMEPWQLNHFIRINHGQSQVTLLGLWCSRKKVVITDPYGKPELFFNECFLKIDDALNNISNLIAHKKAMNNGPDFISDPIVNAKSTHA